MSSEQGSYQPDIKGQTPTIDMTILPIYQVAVEMAERITQRRQTANTFGLALNTALASLFSVFLAISKPHPAIYIVIVMALVGIWSDVIWWLMIRSYRKLNEVKYKVIHELEQSLPAQIYTREWKLLGEENRWRKYWPVSHIESLTPWGFMVIYMSIIVFAIMRGVH